MEQLTGVEVLGCIIVTALIYVPYAIWNGRRQRLMEYTHLPNRYLNGFVRIRSDSEGRALMEADRKNHGV